MHCDIQNIENKVKLLCSRCYEFPLQQVLYHVIVNWTYSCFESVRLLTIKSRDCENRKVLIKLIEIRQSQPTSGTLADPLTSQHSESRFFFLDLPDSGTPWYIYAAVSGAVSVVIVVAVGLITCFLVTCRRKRKHHAKRKTVTKSKHILFFQNPE